MRRFAVEDLPVEYVVDEGGAGDPGTVTIAEGEAETVIAVQVATPDGGVPEIRLFPERSYRHQDLIKRLAREE